MRKLLIFIGFVILAPILYNLDAIYGQWEFNRLCKNEGGSRYYSKVERNVGWTVEGVPGDFSYQVPFDFKYVKFVRWLNKKGERFDVYRDWSVISRPSPRPLGYIFMPVDESLMVRYKFKYTSRRMMHDDRFSETLYEVIDLNANNVVARYREFGFRWTTPERVILSAPTSVSCEFPSNSLEAFKYSVFDAGKEK